MISQLLLTYNDGNGDEGNFSYTLGHTLYLDRKQSTKKGMFLEKDSLNLHSLLFVLIIAASQFITKSLQYTIVICDYFFGFIFHRPILSGFFLGSNIQVKRHMSYGFSSDNYRDTKYL